MFFNSGVLKQDCKKLLSESSTTCESDICFNSGPIRYNRPVFVFFWETYTTLKGLVSTDILRIFIVLYVYLYWERAFATILPTRNKV